jgi:hypothetical protein
MILRPRNISTVQLPDGTAVSFRSQKCSSRVGAEFVARAEKAYDEWMTRVIADFPLGPLRSHERVAPCSWRPIPWSTVRRAPER